MHRDWRFRFETPGGTDSTSILDLGETDITDPGLKHLEGLTRLQSLRLDYNSKVTDAGLKHIEGLTRLQSLGIGCFEVSTPA